MMRLFPLLLLLCLTNVQAQSLVPLSISIHFQSANPNDSVVVQGVFKQHYLGDFGPDTNHWFSSVIHSGEQIYHKLQSAPIAFGYLEIGENLEAFVLPEVTPVGEIRAPTTRNSLVVNAAEGATLTITRAANGQFMLSLPTEQQAINRYLDDHLLLPIVHPSTLDFLARIDTFEATELSQLVDLPEWFELYQRKRIQVFYAKQRLLHSGHAPTAVLIQDTSLIYYSFYHQYLTSFLRAHYANYYWKQAGDEPYEQAIRTMIFAPNIIASIKETFLLRYALLVDYNRKSIGSGLAELAVEYVDNEQLLAYFERKRLRRQLPPGTIPCNFTLLDKDGQAHQLADYHGKVVLLAFWFTSCPSCIAEFPAEQALQETFDDEDFLLISICIRSPAKDWRSFLTSNEVQYTSLYADQEQSRILEAQYQINSYPNFVLIDRDGRIGQDKCRRPSDSKIHDDIHELLSTPRAKR